MSDLVSPEERKLIREYTDKIHQSRIFGDAQGNRQRIRTNLEWFLAQIKELHGEAWKNE